MAGILDAGAVETDKEIEKLEKKLKKVYKEAAQDLSRKTEDYLKAFVEKDSVWQEAVKRGEKSAADYKKWRTGQIMMGNRWAEMRDTIAQDLTNTNGIAMDMIRNEGLPQAYAINHNFGTYQIETGTGQYMSTSYTLYDRDTVKRLVKDNPDLLPKPSVNIPKDLKWNKQKLNGQMLQGILQGESIQAIAKRLTNVAAMDYRAAVRNARTMMTNAQSAGRYDSYRRAKKMGIDFRVMWIATLDGRTRHEHRMLDGQLREVDEPFEVDGQKILYPAYLGGKSYKVPPELVYNCRCTIGAVMRGFEDEVRDLANRNTDRMGGMSYDEWKRQKKAESKKKRVQKETAASDAKPVGNNSANRKVVNGKDISQTWKRRSGEFAFEIEDVIDAQGFDGLPRILPRDKFDEAVKRSNFIAQRTYSAPDQETLDAYRDQLYNGKWYVDCSTGGAQYGQGMYCAADYTGTLSQGIRTEMEHYESLGDARNSGKMINDVPKDTQQKWIDDAISRYYGSDAVNNTGLRTLIESEVLPGSHDWNEVSKAVNALGGYDKVPDMTDVLTDLRTRRTEYKAYTETMTLDPSAKVITWRELGDIRNGNLSIDYRNSIIDDLVKKGGYTEDEQTFIRYNLGTGVSWKDVNDAAKRLSENRIDELSEEFVKIGEKASQAWNEEHDKRIANAKIFQHKYADPGSMAAALGYDAINAEGHGQSGSYTVILNRTKVIFLGE